MKKDSFSNQEASLKSPSIFPQKQDSLQPIPFKYTVFLICAKHRPEVGGWVINYAVSWVSPQAGWAPPSEGMAEWAWQAAGSPYASFQASSHRAPGAFLYFPQAMVLSK